MRLWHVDMVRKLPRQQLLGQHRECCALRGKGWGRKHSIVDYVFKYSPACLFLYHMIVMDEMVKRGYKPDKIWMSVYYRGKNMPGWSVDDMFDAEYVPSYPEHDDAYYVECVNNLRSKGIEI